MKEAGLIPKITKFASKNAPTALAVLGCGAALGAVIFAVMGTREAQDEIEDIEREIKGVEYDEYHQAKKLKKAGKSDEDICNELGIMTVKKVESGKELTKTEIVNDILEMPQDLKKKKLIVYAKNYAPAAALLGLSWFCIYGSCKESSKRSATLASAYILSETARKEYQEKAKAIIGNKKAQDIRDEIIQDRINKNPASKAQVANVDIPNQSNMPNLHLWYDVVSDRYFYSSAERIRRCELEAQSMLDKNGFVSINDIYAILGLKDIPIGNDIGWQKDMNPDVQLIIGGALDEDNNPIGTLEMEVHPSSAWLSEV